MGRVWPINTSKSPFKLILYIFEFKWNRKSTHCFFDFFHNPSIPHHQDCPRSTNRAQIKPVYMQAAPQTSYLSSRYELHFCFLKTNNINTSASDHILNPKSFVSIIQPLNIPRDYFYIHWGTTKSRSLTTLLEAESFSKFQELSKHFNSLLPLVPSLFPFFRELSPCTTDFFLASKAKNSLVIST